MRKKLIKTLPVFPSAGWRRWRPYWCNSFHLLAVELRRRRAAGGGGFSWQFIVFGGDCNLFSYVNFIINTHDIIIGIEKNIYFDYKIFDSIY